MGFCRTTTRLPSLAPDPRRLPNTRSDRYPVAGETLTVETSPRPTRLNRPDVGIGWRHIGADWQMRSQYIRGLAGGWGESVARLHHLRQLAASKGKDCDRRNLARVFESRHVN